MRSTAMGRVAKCDTAPAGEGAPPIRSPLKFFLLVFALSAPFWLAGGMTELQMMPTYTPRSNQPSTLAGSLLPGLC